VVSVVSVILLLESGDQKNKYSILIPVKIFYELYKRNGGESRLSEGEISGKERKGTERTVNRRMEELNRRQDVISR